MNQMFICKVFSVAFENYVCLLQICDFDLIYLGLLKLYSADISISFEVIESLVNVITYLLTNSFNICLSLSLFQIEVL